MKIIILAAGRGSRLEYLTLDKPKCMLEFQGKSLLDTQIALYHKLKLNDIVLIKGYLGDLINIKGIKYFVDRDVFNMVHTLFHAESEMNTELIIAYGDIIFEEAVLKKLLASSHDISVVVDISWKDYFEARFSSPYSEAESLVMTPDYRILEIGESDPLPEKVQGQYIGLIKISKKGCGIFRRLYQSEKKKYWGKPWIRERIFEKAYLTDMLQVVIDKGYPVYGIPIFNGWLEFDTVSDYQNYLKWDKNGRLKKFYKGIK
jgi:phosphoenolpyruvate phosphomutase